MALTAAHSGIPAVEWHFYAISIAIYATISWGSQTCYIWIDKEDGYPHLKPELRLLYWTHPLYNKDLCSSLSGPVCVVWRFWRTSLFSGIFWAAWKHYFNAIRKCKAQLLGKLTVSLAAQRTHAQLGFWALPVSISNHHLAHRQVIFVG